MMFFFQVGFIFVFDLKKNNKSEGVTQYSFGQSKKQNPTNISP
jgi:hypothetical protein